MSWTSHYIYYGDDCYGREIDRLLISAVAPWVRRLFAARAIRRFFFVRYADAGGPHLRLRLDLVREGGDAVVEERLCDAVDDFHASEIATGRASAGRRPEVRAVDYVPELERYGGRHAIVAAEDLSFLSSRIALEIIASSLADERQSSAEVPAPGLGTRRLGKALLMAVILGRSFFDHTEAVAAFLERYSRFYFRLVARDLQEPESLHQHLGEESAREVPALSSAIGSLLVTLDGRQGLGVPLLDSWYRGCLATRQVLRQLMANRQLELAAPVAVIGAASLESIIGSYLHLHHNRLGLGIPQEVHLTHLAADALTRQGVEA